MKKGAITIDKWHFKFGIIPIYWTDRGYMFHFGIFKPISYPKEGEMPTKINYKGFWLRREIKWEGFEISI